MKKGFVLTLDAMVAASIAIIMSFAIVQTASVKSPEISLPYSAAGDLLSAMDAKGELARYSGFSAAQIEQSMQSALQALPKSICGGMTTRIFKAEDFDRSDSYSESSCAGGTEASKAKRIFADYNREKFGIIELSVWLK